MGVDVADLGVGAEEVVTCRNNDVVEARVTKEIGNAAVIHDRRERLPIPCGSCVGEQRRRSPILFCWLALANAD